ncbi:hypothetical protein ACFX13_006065 [Malus domestica]
MRAKIANFGASKNWLQCHNNAHCWNSRLHCTRTKMDVFYFGVVLLELISRKEAIDEDGNVLCTCAGRILEGNEEEKARKLREWVDNELFLESCSMESKLNVVTECCGCCHYLFA